MNWLKKLFRKRKPLIYTSLEIKKVYKEDDPWENDFDRAIDWEREKRKVKKGK